MKSLKNGAAALAALLILVTTGLAGAGGAAPTGVVNINEASLAELQLLPGIGLAKAKAIAEHRRAQRFTSVDDLTRVKGIGEKLVDKIRDHVVVRGRTTAKAPARKKKKTGKKRPK
jgi:competence protein ComEA